MRHGDFRHFDRVKPRLKPLLNSGSAGMGIGKAGLFKANAIELDIDYDYEKHEKEINIYLGRQEFKNSVFVFELLMIFGADCQRLSRSGGRNFIGGKTAAQFFNVLDRSYPHQTLFKNSQGKSAGHFPQT